MVPAVTADVEQERTVRPLHHLLLVALGTDAAAEFPGLAAIVAEDDVRLLRLADSHDVVARHDQSARLGLDADARARSVPRPVRLLHVTGDLDWLGPGA